MGKIVGGHARAYNLRSQASGKRGCKIVETPVVTSLTYYIDLMCWFLEGNPVVEVYARGNSSGIYYGLPEQYPSRGLSSRVELLGSEGVLLIDGDNTDEILYAERGVPHVHLAGQEANMVFLGSPTPGSWALGDFWEGARHRDPRVAGPSHHGTPLRAGDCRRCAVQSRNFIRYRAFRMER